MKSLSQDRLEHGLQEFLKEASSMQSVSHSNIVTFYGIVFQQDKELMLVSYSVHKDKKVVNAPDIVNVNYVKLYLSGEALQSV